MTCGRCGVSGESKHFSAAGCCEALKDQLAGAVGEVAALKSQRSRLQACPSCGEHLIDKVAAEVLDELFKPVRERLENVGLALRAERDALRTALLLVAETQKCAKDGLPCWCADGDHDNCAEACSAARAALQPPPQRPAPAEPAILVAAAVSPGAHCTPRGWHLFAEDSDECLCGGRNRGSASPGPAPEAK